MKLYFSPGACSMAPHIVLQESGLKYATEQVNLRNKQTANGGDYLKINPKGSVPALELDNGQILTEAAVVMQYIADQKPEAGLIPKQGTFERYRCQEWLNWLSTEIHKGFGPLWNPTSPEETKATARETLAKKFDWITPFLQDSHFLMGAHFTVADAYFFTLLGWTQLHKIDMAKWPALMGYVERIRSRPAVQTVLKNEGLLK